MILLRYTPDGTKRTVDLRDAFAGQTAILIGGAPSLRTQNIKLLEQRGVLTMAMNNAAIHVRPVLWAASDHPECFEPQILLDPGIMKFAAHGYSDVKLDERYRGIQYRSAPNLYFYMQEDKVPIDEYLADRKAVPWYNNTLFVSIHLLYRLGVRRIILAGSDFGFGQDGRMYAHETMPDDVIRKWNAGLYDSLAYDLRRLKPLFDAAGLSLYDCSVSSRISQVYEHISLEQAVDMCLSGFPSKMVDPATLPHCSKFAPDRIKDDVARWPGYNIIGGDTDDTPPSPQQQNQVL